MNQTVKIFFTDMDDTLLNSEKQVTKENMDAISEALAAGHKIVFNTGRPLSGFLPILKELGLDREGCYAIAFTTARQRKRCTAARFRSNMHA